MGKRRKANPLKDMLDLVSLLPWWAGVAIAVIGYLVLHGLATPVQVTAVRPGQVGQVMIQAVVVSFANAGQYFLPLVSLIAAAISFFRHRHRAALVADVARSQSVNALSEMSWREFEMLVGEAYRFEGYRVLEGGGGGADGGIDLAMTKGNEVFLVQCKQWKAFKVGVNVVRELYGAMAAKGATGGFVVTSGRFTYEAKAFAEGRNVQLVDGSMLFTMIKQARKSPFATAQPSSGESPMAQSKSTGKPMCPRCGSSMVKRVARSGRNAGCEFWGCPKFPTCRGLRTLN
jgi:restriction system protein